MYYEGVKNCTYLFLIRPFISVKETFCIHDFWKKYILCKAPLASVMIF